MSQSCDDGWRFYRERNSCGGRHSRVVDETSGPLIYGLEAVRKDQEDVKARN